MLKNSKYIITFVAGSLVSIIIFTPYRSILERNIEAILVGAIAFCLISAAVIAISYLYVVRIIKINFNASDFSPEQTIKLLDSAVQEFASGKIKSKQHLKVISEATAFVITRWFFQGIVSLLLAVIATVGGTAGTILLMQQNEKLAEQTELFREQNDYTRRAFVKTKTDDRRNLIDQARDIRNSLSSDEIFQLALDHGKWGDLYCNSQRTIATTSEDTNIALKTSLLRLANDVSGYMDQTEGELDHHRAARSKLLEMLVGFGLPFSVYSVREFKNVNISDLSARKANLDSAQISGILNNVDFSEVCSSSLWLQNVEARSINFKNSVLRAPIFSHGNFSYSNFSGANIFSAEDPDGFIFDDKEKEPFFVVIRDFIKIKIAQIRSWLQSEPYSGYDSVSLTPSLVLGNAYISYSDFILSDFRRSKLKEVTFKKVNLSGSSFHEAIFTSANHFDGINLSHVDFRIASQGMSFLAKSTFKDVKFLNTAVDGLDFGDNPTVDEAKLKQACVCDRLLPRIKGKEIMVNQCKKMDDDSLLCRSSAELDSGN